MGGHTTRKSRGHGRRDSDGGSSCAREEPQAALWKSSMLSASSSMTSSMAHSSSAPAKKVAGTKRESPALSIPPGSEAPYLCFPLSCLKCGSAVDLLSPAIRMQAANTRILSQFRCLAETVTGNTNKEILRAIPRPAGRGRAREGRRGSSDRSRVPGPAPEPVLYMPGCGYFCSAHCMKRFVLSMASSDNAHVESGRNTRRVALLHATQAAELDKVSALLMSGAHVNIADEKGRTPLHIAAELGDPVLSDRVLIGGFNVLTYTACMAHHHAQCRCFNQRPNFAKRDYRGYTPLHTAASMGKPGIIYKLLAAGADPHAEDAHGHAPQDVAANQECYALLRGSSDVIHEADRLRHTTLRVDHLERTLGPL